MIRIGVVGCGGIARRMASELQAHEGVQITAVVDPSSENAARLAELTGARAFRKLSEAIPHVDAAYVATPPRVRLQIIRSLAEAGRGVLCEKPLAATVSEAREISTIVGQHGIPFMMGFMRRWHRPYRHLKSLADDPERLGRPLHLYRQRLGYLRPQPGNWRVEPGQSCGLTIESVSHDLDLLRWIGGEITSARGEVLYSDPSVPGFDDTVSAVLTFASGAIGSLQVSWASRVQRNECGLIGSNEAAVISGPGMWDSTVLNLGSKSSDIPLDAADGEDLGYTGESDAFVRFIGGEQLSVPGVGDGLRTVEIAHEILQSTTLPT